jgi:8-oxo-dGTP diphosphatase
VLAGCVLIDRDGRILLLHRSIGAVSQWELPGGKVEPHESPENAAAREIEEELGVGVSGLTLVGDARFRQGGQAWRYFWYLPEFIEGSPTLREPDRFDRLAFHRPVDLTRMMSSLSPNFAILICAYFDGQLLLPHSRSWRRAA